MIIQRREKNLLIGAVTTIWAIDETFSEFNRFLEDKKPSRQANVCRLGSTVL